MADNTDLLDLMINLDEIQGHQHAFISIRPNTRINNPRNPQIILDFINRIRALVKEHGIRHGLRKGTEVKTELKRYLGNYAEIKASKTFFTIPLASPTEPVTGADGSLEILIDLKLKPGKIKNEKTGKIDYYDLGFSEKLIKEGTTIAIINQAQEGIDGLNIFNQPIKASPGKSVQIPEYDRKSITREEDPENLRTLLKAGITGFLYHEPGRGYFIDKDVLTRQVDFSTGNIEIDDFSGIDSIIKVSGSRDIMRDSVKPGFSLKAREVIVDGNVGRGAHIEGETIKITGIVDSKARIIGRNIEIGKAVGAYIEGDEIRANEVLQDSEIIGRQVRVNTCMASRLIGEDVFINNELRSGTVTAASFIFCNRATGSSHSSLTIDPLQIPCFQNRLAEHQVELDERQKEEKELRLIYEKDLGRHEDQHQPKLDLFLKQIQDLKNIRISTAQKKAIEQLVLHGKLDDLSKLLNLKLQSLTRNNLEKFAASSEKMNQSFAAFEESRTTADQARSAHKELEESHKHALILINGDSVGEIKVCYLDNCLSPVVYNQTILFNFDQQKNRVLTLKKFNPVTHRRLFERMSPRALAVINKFS